jgi:lipopolysaccharide/colanic/teichoic acid biosynthesis glycosyltransferase
MSKRVLDVLVSASALVLLSPLLVFIATCVWWRLGFPILFRQVRPGFHGRPFEMIKFRTMRDLVDASGKELSDDQRLSGLGRRLRKASLDELPELWNVLKGDMSLVGPRPLLMGYLPLYSSEQARRHEVRPGITGWAQVNGRNATNWEDRLTMDVWYVDHRSLLLDLKILGLTVAAVFSARGVSHDGHATMPKFTGTLANHDE